MSQIYQQSPKGLKLTESEESCVLHVYPDVDDYPTIGFGSRFYDNGEPVKFGDPDITQAYALQLLSYHCNILAEQISKLITVSLTQNQIDALIDLVYNIGITAFTESTLLRCINQAADNNTIRKQFMRWIYSKGVILDDLKNRRTAEYLLWVD